MLTHLLICSVADGPLSRESHSQMAALAAERMIWMRTFGWFVSLAIIAFALGAEGCSSTTASIEQSWRSPIAMNGELIHVVTLFPSHDVALRRTVEDKLARALQRRGMRAVPAYTVLANEEIRDRDPAIAALRTHGFDGVVAMRVVGTEHKLDYDPTFSLYWGASSGAGQNGGARQGGRLLARTTQLIWSALSYPSTRTEWASW
jgi:hypothetical protein